MRPPGAERSGGEQGKREGSPDRVNPAEHQAKRRPGERRVGDGEPKRGEFRAENKRADGAAQRQR